MEINAEACLNQKNNMNRLAESGVKLIKGGVNVTAPRFSIVVPTYKRLETLKDTVTSALTQKTEVPFDVIVVEDNPEPDSPICRYLTALDDDRLSYYRNEKNLGLVDNFNRAVSLSDAPYAVLVHDDDYLLPDYIESIDKVISLKNEADIICPAPVKWLEYKGEPAPVVQEEQKQYPLWKPLSDWEPFCRLFAPTGVTFRKEAFMRSGGFDSMSGPSTDLYYIVRVGKSLNYYRYEKPLFVYRWSENESMKFSTRADFINAGYPLRKYILSENKVCQAIAGPLLKRYCDKTLTAIRRDFPNEKYDGTGLPLPKNRFDAWYCRKFTDAVAGLLLLRRHFYVKI